jgi:predicted cation transporter
MATVLADTVLIVHALIVLFIVGGFAAIWCGAARHWRWVRERRFRFVHLASIGIVAALALLGVPCPLTTIEASLRHGQASSQGFIAYWVGRLLYYDLPTWLFTATYAAFALIVLLTWRFVPPRPRS